MLNYIENEQKKKEIERLIYNVAHDLKAPIVTFSAFLSFLKEDVTNGNTENAFNSLAHIENAAAKMTTLIHNFVELSQTRTMKTQALNLDKVELKKTLEPPKKVSILLVEDDNSIREAICKILEKSGYSVATASDGLDAFQYLRNNPSPSLILLDYRMPRMDGETFRREQMKDKVLFSIPTILISALSLTPEAIESLKLNIVVEKPFQINSFLQIVGSFFENKSDCKAQLQH